MKTTRPLASAVITASPMLFSVMLNCFSAALAASCASWRAIVSELTKRATIMKVASRMRSSGPTEETNRTLHVIAESTAQSRPGRSPAYAETITTAIEKTGEIAEPIQCSSACVRTAATMVAPTELKYRATAPPGFRDTLKYEGDNVGGKLILFTQILS